MTHTHLVKGDVISYLKSQIDENKQARPILQAIVAVVENESYPKVTKQERVGNVLTPDEIDECRRMWAESTGVCAENMNETFPELPATIEGWMVYCQWACGEYGLSPFE